MNEALYNERAVLQQIAEGSEQAFGQLFHAYRPKLYTYIFKLSKSAETAEDTVHEVFLKLWKNREKLLSIENINAYLYRMAHNHAYTILRRAAKETLVLAELQQEQSGISVFEGEDRISSQEIRDFIRKTIAQLTPQQKQVFLMSREQGLKHEEIAQKLNISANTVKNHMVEALKFIRGQIDQSYGSNAIALFVIYQLTTS